MGGSKRSRPSRLQVAQITATFHPVRPSKLGIFGLGAIGGSLALQAKRAGIATVLGWSPEPAERVAAARQGAIDDAPPRAVDVARAVELLVLAAPPAANLQLLVSLEPHIGAGALVTDVGSVKRAIVARADGLRIGRSEEHTSELQSHSDLVCRLLLEKKKKRKTEHRIIKTRKEEIHLTRRRRNQ